MGRYTIHLVGESNYQQAVGRLSIGEAVQLLPEPDNPHDPRAIRAVDVTGATLGYVERGSWIARAMLDEKTSVRARVLEIIGGGAEQTMQGVVLEVLTATDADAGFAAPRAQPSAQLYPGQRPPDWQLSNSQPQGTTHPRSNGGCLIVGIIAVIALSAWIMEPSKDSSSAVPTPSAIPTPAPLDEAAVEKCRDLLKLAEKSGVVRERPSPNRINVDEKLWAQLSAREKDLTLQAMSCDLWGTAMPPDDTKYVVVYGYHTGKRVQMLTSVGMSRE